MKPLHKIFWLSPENKETDTKFLDALNNGWAPAFYMPTNEAVMVVLWKDTDILDGLDLKVAKEKNENKSTK